MEWGGEQARRITSHMLVGRETGNRIVIETHPIGVVAAFTPWNYPMALASKKFDGALDAGCSIICKPSEETPGSVLGLVRALLDAGVPPAAIGVVLGNPAEVSTHLINASPVSKITFTGSVSVEKLLAAQAGRVMKPVTMELGGHAPVIICADADPEAAADYLVARKFANTGQICLSPTRFFVEGRIYDQFVDRFVAKAQQIRVGPGHDADTQIGSLASERRVRAISKLVEDAQTKGARILTGGMRLGTVGSYYASTVLTDVPPSARILHEEPFGPVAPILRFKDEAEMLCQANAVEYGLFAYLFTNDAGRQRRLTEAMHSARSASMTYLSIFLKFRWGAGKTVAPGRKAANTFWTPTRKRNLSAIDSAVVRKLREAARVCGAHRTEAEKAWPAPNARLSIHACLHETQPGMFVGEVSMEPFRKLSGIAAPFPVINVDTDMIIPKDYMKTIKRIGLGIGLFADVRYMADGSPRMDFVLNKPSYRDAAILIAGDNFGCGSSREHAPWALLDFGIRCIISTSFADIFCNNCFKNGILPIVLRPAEHEKLMADAIHAPSIGLSVDLEAQVITDADGHDIAFDVDAFRRHCLLNGLDEIALTLENAASIARFEALNAVSRPWLGS